MFQGRNVVQSPPLPKTDKNRNQCKGPVWKIRTRKMEKGPLQTRKIPIASTWWRCRSSTQSADCEVPSVEISIETGAILTDWTILSEINLGLGLRSLIFRSERISHKLLLYFIHPAFHSNAG